MRSRTKLAAVLGAAALLGAALGCAGGARVDGPELNQSHHVQRSGSGVEQRTTTTIEIAPPGTPLPPRETAPPPGAKPSKTKLGAAAPAMLDLALAMVGSMAGDTPTKSASPGAPANPGSATGDASGGEPVIVMIDGKQIMAPAGSAVRLTIDDYSDVTAPTASVQAQAHAEGASLRGAGKEMLAKFKAGMPSYKLPGLPDADGASAGVSGGGGGGGGAYGANLSIAGGGLNAFHVFGAALLLGAGAVWWFGRPVFTRVALVMGAFGLGFIGLGVFVEWEFAPFLVVAMGVAGVVALVWWLRNRKKEDDAYDALQGETIDGALKLRAALGAVVAGVEKAPAEAASAVKRSIQSVATETGEFDDIQATVREIKREEGVAAGSGAPRD